VLIHKDSRAAVEIVQINMFITGLLSLFLGLSVYSFAPFIVHLVFGSEFDGAISVLRILAILLPIVSVSTVLGPQWMLPIGLDWPFNVFIIFGAGLNIVLCLYLIPNYYHIGGAISLLVTEVFILLGLFLYLYRKDLNPLTGRLILKKENDL
jgi:PST family polysaccharide transporter